MIVGEKWQWKASDICYCDCLLYHCIWISRSIWLSLLPRLIITRICLLSHALVMYCAYVHIAWEVPMTTVILGELASLTHSLLGPSPFVRYKRCVLYYILISPHSSLPRIGSWIVSTHLFTRQSTDAVTYATTHFFTLSSRWWHLP